MLCTTKCIIINLKKPSIDRSFLSFQILTKSGSNAKRIQEVNKKKLQNNWLELPQENIQFLVAYARQRWRRFSRNLRFAFGFAINIWHWDHFFLQFSHNKYAILSYKGEEKKLPVKRCTLLTYFLLYVVQFSQIWVITIISARALGDFLVITQWRGRRTKG